MSKTITNFPNSFIQFCGDNSTCNDYNGVVYPIKYLGDIGFMVLGTGSSLEDAGSLLFSITTQCFNPGDDFNAEGEYIIVASIADNVSLYEEGVYLHLLSDDLCMELDLSSSGATDGQCLHIVAWDQADNKVVCCSDQIFKYNSQTCFTEVVKYKCADDSYNFPYEAALIADANFFNRIRLNIDLTSPSPVTKKKGFKLSDGSFRTLSANKEKEWDVETDWLDDHTHQCLDAAIDHDTVYFIQDPPDACTFTDYQIFHPEDDKYDIDWQDGPGQHLGVAKAKFKIKTNPYYSQNSNC